VLLASGVPPASAWGYLAEVASGAGRERVEAVARAATTVPVAEAILASVVPDSGGSLDDGAAPDAAAKPDAVAKRAHPTPRRTRPATVFSDAAWRGLAAAWTIATEAGASLAPNLRDFAGSLRDLAATQRECRVALAGPAATAKFVMVLPAVGVLFGVALGFDTLGVLFTTVPGGLCLGAGLALLWAARRWNRRLLRRAAPQDLTPGLELELLSIAVSGGASIERARRAVAEAMERCGLDAAGDDARGVLNLSRRAGVPAAALLRAEAEQARVEARFAAQEKAAALSVTLMMPLGLCTLPAFLLLGVAPLMIAVLSSTALGF
jgi:tight adherence protein B